MWFFCIGIIVFIIGAFASLAVGKIPKGDCPNFRPNENGTVPIAAPKRASIIAAISAVTGSILCSVNAIAVLHSGQRVETTIPWRIPLGNIILGIDPLSAIFVLPIAAIVAIAAVYGIQYLDASKGTVPFSLTRKSGQSLIWFFYNILAAAMLLVVTAKNGLFFLICWEIMSLASFFLVISDHQSDSVRRAGWIYLIATHLGTACLLVLFLVLGSKENTLDFDFFSTTSGMAGILFVLAVIGFGTKAGFMPLHVWLPEAHPSAPSHISAVMSGVMIKTGIYGLLRTLTFLGESQPWWGWTLIGIGVASGILGILFALAQHDLKRLLAYSSVENIGIISIGLGVGLLGIGYKIPAMALLGFLGAILHVINHSLFKSLLFLGAGAIQHSTGTRDMNRLGGLLKLMPFTGGTFLVGASAISALPVLNGFVSELLIYLGVLTGVLDLNQEGGMAWILLCVVVIGGLAIIGGLAAACFTKAFGSVFLGEPRSDDAKHAHEVGKVMRAAMLILAAACILISLSAPLWPTMLQSCVVSINSKFFEDISDTTRSAAVLPLTVLCAATWSLLCIAGILAYVRKKLLSGRNAAQGPTWDCGYIAPSASMQYSASSYTNPLVSLFRMFLRPKTRLRAPQGLFPNRASFHSETPDVFKDYLYRPVFFSVVWAASKLRWLQHGRIQLYVLYIALTILVLLIWKLG